MNQQLTTALEQANKIIATQLSLTQCLTDGRPNLRSETCLQCAQIGPCIWRHTSSENLRTTNTQEQRKDLTFVHRLVNQAVSGLNLSPADHKQALMWLRSTSSLLLLPK